MGSVEPGGMVQVESFQSDSGSTGGDGNLTETTHYPGVLAPNRVRDYWFDWRDRESAEKQWAGQQHQPADRADGFDGNARLVSVPDSEGNSVLTDLTSRAPQPAP